MNSLQAVHVYMELVGLTVLSGTLIACVYAAIDLFYKEFNLRSKYYQGSHVDDVILSRVQKLESEIDNVINYLEDDEITQEILTQKMRSN